MFQKILSHFGSINYLVAQSKMNYMNDPITVVTFTTSVDIKYMLFKEMLEEAGIRYMLINEYTSSIDGVFKAAPSNIGIEVRVMPENVDEALEIWESIK